MKSWYTIRARGTGAEVLIYENGSAKVSHGSGVILSLRAA